MSEAAGGASLPSDPTPIDLRAKIVGILSDTANGCLTELGYFPGLLKKLQELEQINARWKEENVKLFRDNQALAQIARYHEDDDRSKQANIAPNSSGKLASLEEHVKLLNIQNAELKKKNEGLLANSLSQCSHVPYQQLLADYHQLTVLYRTAMAEIHHLRQVIQVSSAPCPDRHNAPSPTNPIRSADPRLLQQQRVHLAQRLAKGQLANQAIPSIFPRGPPLAADPRNAVYPGSTCAATPVALSLNHNIASSIRPTPGTANAMQRPLGRLYSIPNPIPQQMTHSARVMRVSPSGIHPPFRYPSLTIKTSDPLLPSDRRFSQSGETRNGSPSARQDDQISASTSRPPTQSPSQTTTRSLSPIVKKTSTSNTPVVDFAPYKSSSPPESAGIPTPVSSALETPLGVASSPLLGTDQLKRVREDVDVGLADESGSAKKKPRLDEGDLVNTAINNAEKEAEDAEDESDQEIDVDADGLRSIASCISELVETRAEDPQVQMCRLCDIRHKNGLISEVPKPFLRVTQDDLVQHMMAEHPDAWETLRRDV